MLAPKTLGAFGLSLGLIMSAAMPAMARGTEDDLRDRLEEANARLVQLETHEMSDEAAAEFGQARLEVSEIQGKLTTQDWGWAMIILNRLEARLDLAESVLDRATVEELADQRETELFDMQTEADNLQIELESLQQRRNHDYCAVTTQGS